MSSRRRSRLGQGSGVGVLLTTMVLLTASGAIISPLQGQTTRVGGTAADSTSNLNPNITSNASLSLTCPNGICEPSKGETELNCPQDCSVCPSGICTPPEQNPASSAYCPQDCLCTEEPEARFDWSPQPPTWLQNVTINASDSGPHRDCLEYEWSTPSSYGSDHIDKTSDGPVMYHNFSHPTGDPARFPNADRTPEYKCHDPDAVLPPYGDGRGDPGPTECGYVLTLNVTDREGRWDSVTRRINVGTKGEPIPALSVETPRVPNYPIEFDASQSRDTRGVEGNVGSIERYDYDFGDGDECEDCAQVVTHEYDSVGGRWVDLNVTDSDGYSSTLTEYVYVSDNEAPEEDPGVTTASGDSTFVPGETVTFQADFIDPEALQSGSNFFGIQSYEWDVGCDDPGFPDGTGSAINADFNDAGEDAAEVCINVTDKQGNWEDFRYDWDVQDSRITEIWIKKPHCGYGCGPDGPEIKIRVSFFAAEAGEYYVDVNGFQTRPNFRLSNRDLDVHLPCQNSRAPDTPVDCANQPGTLNYLKGASEQAMTINVGPKSSHTVGEQDGEAYDTDWTKLSYSEFYSSLDVCLVKGSYPGTDTMHCWDDAISTDGLSQGNSRSESYHSLAP